MRIRRFLFGLFICQAIAAFLVLPSYAFEKPTHQAINEYVAKNLIHDFSLNEYLMDQMGFKAGIAESLHHQVIKLYGQDPPVWWLLAYGGRKEDEPVTRAFNHFHNPLKMWDRAGLKESDLGRSSILWGQSSEQFEGRYSWQDVRGYFYSALTHPDHTMREHYFAETIRGLGQLMHLVEDTSVPLHARDDIHIIFHYENWVEKLRREERFNFALWLADSPRYGYNQSILDLDSNPLAPIPIARIIDTDKYTGVNPYVTVSELIGLAEYTNANFFSSDTIFKNFPYPNWDSVEIEPYTIMDPRNPSRTVFRDYYKKVRDGDTGYRLATVGFLSHYLVTYFPDSALSLKQFEVPALDANVYRDYAERLIPRAVGYSAGLLKYFFRAKLKMAPDPSNCYGYIIENHSKEDMEGTFEIYYDNSTNERVQVWSDHLMLGPLGSDENTSSNILFTEPNDAKEPGKYILVFRGRLGNEEAAVVGKANVYIVPPENLILNGDCECDCIWQRSTPPEVLEFTHQTDEKAHTGEYSWKIGSFYRPSANPTLSNYFHVDAGKAYDVSFWVNPGHNWMGGVHYLVIRFYHGGHGHLGWYSTYTIGDPNCSLFDPQCSPRRLAPGQWNHITFRHVATETGCHARLGIGFRAEGEREPSPITARPTYLYFDDVSVGLADLD